MKDLRVGLEGDARAGVFGQAEFLDIGGRYAALVLLLIGAAAAMDLGLNPFGKRRHRLGADAVQACRNLVGVVIEFRTRPHHRQHDFERRPLGFGMFLDGNTPAIVAHGQTAVDVDLDQDGPAKAGEGFIDAVIHQLIHEMMQPATRDIADVHARPLANVGGILEDLDILLAIASRAIIRGPLGDRRFHRPGINKLFTHV